MFTGSFIMLATIYASSLVTDWWMFVLSYGVGFPFGAGLCYWPPIISGWEWFPNNKGMISGLIIGGYGFGAFIFGFISTALVNPQNKKPDIPDDGTGTKDELFPKEVAERVPHMFHICLLIWAGLCIIAILCVSRNP